MNINDVEFQDRGGDMLEEIFARQRELMEKYHVIEAKNGLLQTPDIPVNLHDAKGQARLKDFAWRITEELGEAMNCLKNKPWKQTQMLTDVKHYYEELADAFHFFVELCILSGLNARDLYELYFRKSEVNKFRQRSNY
jgi:hypothetical protein